MDEYFGITQEEKDKNQSYWDKYGSSEQTEGGDNYSESDFSSEDVGNDSGDIGDVDTSVSEPSTPDTGGEDVDF